MNPFFALQVLSLVRCIYNDSRPMFHLAIVAVFLHDRSFFQKRNWLVLSFGMMGRMIGSCTGSQVILELLLNGTSPAAIVCQADEIIALGAIVAEELFDRRLPVVFLEVRDDRIHFF